MPLDVARAWVTNAKRDNLSLTAPFEAKVEAFTLNQAEQARGWLWRPGCPVVWEDLRILKVTYKGFDGRSHTGRLLTHKDRTSSLAQAFAFMYADGFRIDQMDYMITLAVIQYPDLATNNTYSFHCRKMTSGSSWSEHAYGRAVDINPVQNPYVRPSTGYVFPPAGAAFVRRIPLQRGMIGPASATETAFYHVGWTWGGRWSSIKDYMHFSTTGR